ncbi:MAG: hypothetical protein ACJA0U_000757 [Salibacteraceae bacterium]|jgi:hypothetical protein
MDVAPGRDDPFPAQVLKIHKLGAISPDSVQEAEPDSKSSEKNDV